MSTIDVTDRLVLHQDDVFAFQDEIGFFLQGDEAPSLINEGRISLSMTATDYTTAIVACAADNALIWNKLGGVMAFHAADSAGPEVFATQVSGAGTTLRNDGEASFRAEREVIATLFDGAGARFINTGLWRVSVGDLAGDKAGGGYFRVSEIINSGRFLVTGDEAFGAYMLGSPAGASLHNSGLIKISGTTGAACVSLYDVYPDFHLDNSGRMLAHSWGFPSIGITMPAQGHAFIANSGLIHADKAIWSPGNSGSGSLVNGGRVIGDVILGDGFDTVVNSGLIDGEVRLGNGGDRYDGVDGVLKGVLWGEGGYDTLIGGKGADEIHGDDVMVYWSDGADLLKGGGGVDTLFGGGGADTLEGGRGGDFLHGDGGADMLEGGHGADAYVFTALADSSPDTADTIASLHADDWIDLSSIDADADTPGDQAFAPDQVTVSFDGESGETRIELDGDRDGAADFALIIAAGHFSLDHLVL